MAVRFSALSVNLSKLLVDSVALAADDGLYYSSAQRTIGLNNAEEQIIAKIADSMKFEDVSDKYPSLIKEATLTLGSGDDLPDGCVKVYTCCESNYNPLVFVKPKDWHSIKKGSYNPEQSDSTFNKRWTSFDNKIYVTGSLTSVKIMYLKDHVAITPAGSNDFILPPRFDPEILQLAYKYLIETLTTK